MIKNYNIEYSLNSTNFILIDGLTVDVIKRKYIWLLNALVENAIIGQDDYGLVWYSGDWIAGEWEDGTWYSGIWYDGEWKNGKFYSYSFDKQQLVLRNKRILEKDNNIHSQFRSGIWRRGEFYGGYFGPNILNDDWQSKTRNNLLTYPTRWESGIFYNGIFRNSVWAQPNDSSRVSVFKNGIFYNSQWLNGTFQNGTFQGNKWWSGNFTGGDFVIGDWITGTFNQVNSNIKSRFGSMPFTGTSETYSIDPTDSELRYCTNMSSVTWHDGTFIGGEFHACINIISGKTNISKDHRRSVWITGDFQNGVWFGGTFMSGNFNNGYWLSGVWEGGTMIKSGNTENWVDGIFNNGYWLNGYWKSGIINNGFIIQGIFNSVTSNGGQMGYQPNTNILQSLTKDLTVPPKLYE